MEIRKATVWDAQRISELWALMMHEIEILNRVADEKEREKFFLHLLIRIKGDNGFILVAVDNGEIIGFLDGYTHYYEYGTSDLIGTCESVYLKPEHRSKGIAKKLIDEAIEFAKDKYVKEMEFLTKYDPKIIKAWERKGYVPAQITYIKKLC